MKNNHARNRNVQRELEDTKCRSMCGSIFGIFLAPFLLHHFFVVSISFRNLFLSYRTQTQTRICMYLFIYTIACIHCAEQQRSIKSCNVPRIVHRDTIVVIGSSFRRTIIRFNLHVRQYIFLVYTVCITYVYCIGVLTLSAIFVVFFRISALYESFVRVEWIPAICSLCFFYFLLRCIFVYFKGIYLCRFNCIYTYTDHPDRYTLHLKIWKLVVLCFCCAQLYCFATKIRKM